MKHGGETMEQLTLFESGEIRRLPRYGDDTLGRVSGGFQLQYEHLNGQLFQGNSIDWLASLDDASVDLVFADPPYNITTISSFLADIIQMKSCCLML
jgi:16S rRNA G966 N2-methylase RsmD